MKIESLNWQINSNCNLNCKHCVVAQSLYSNKDIDFNEAKKNIIFLKRYGLQKIIFSLREPLLYHDIYRLIQYCSDHYIKTEIITNGTLLTTNNICNLIKAKISEINISLDGISELSHDYIRGDGVFSTVIRNINKLVEIRDFNNYYIPIKIKFTINSKSIDEINKIPEFFNTLGINTLLLNEISIDGNAIEHSFLKVRKIDYLDSIDNICYIYSNLKRKNYSLFLVSLMPFPKLFLNLKYGLNITVYFPVCMSRKNGYSLDSRGVLYSCARNIKSFKTDLHGSFDIPNIKLNEFLDLQEFQYHNEKFHHSMQDCKVLMQKKLCEDCFFYNNCNLCPLNGDTIYYDAITTCQYYNNKLKRVVSEFIKDSSYYRIFFKETAYYKIVDNISYLTNSYFDGGIFENKFNFVNPEIKIIRSIINKKNGIILSDLLQLNNCMRENDLNNFFYKIFISDCFMVRKEEIYAI